MNLYVILFAQYFIYWYNVTYKNVRRTIVVSCCLSGLRYKDFPFDIEKDLAAAGRYRETLRDKIIRVIDENGITHFVTGLSSETEIDLAETVLSLRDEEGYPFTLECIVLGTSQLKNLSEDDIFRHNAVLVRADKRMKLSQRFLMFRKYKRDITMLCKCEMLLSVINNDKKKTDALFGYALKRGIPVETVNLSNFRLQN